MVAKSSKSAFETACARTLPSQAVAVEGRSISSSSVSVPGSRSVSHSSLFIPRGRSPSVPAFISIQSSSASLNAWSASPLQHILRLNGRPSLLRMSASVSVSLASGGGEKPGNA